MHIVWEVISTVWHYAGGFVSIGFFFIAIFIARSTWTFYREEHYKSSKRLLPWVYLEIKIPREVLKGPKAMEQFFAALHPLGNFPASFAKRWWDGEVPRWHVIDIIGKNSEVRFYMRVSSKINAAIEGLLYAAYPEIEIIEVEDPLLQFPATYDELDQQGYQIFGNELMQTGSQAISIRTYAEFEQESGDEKGRIIDPFSVLLELIGNLQPSEMLLIQYVLVPSTSKQHHYQHWRHEGEHLLEKYRDTTQQIGQDKEGKPQYRFRFRTPTEEATIKRIEDKFDKGVFDTTIRYLHIAPKEIFNFHIGYRGIQTFFNQFRHDKQTLERNYHVITKGEWYYFPWIFADARLRQRRRMIYDEYMRRFVPEETVAGMLYNSGIWTWCFYHKPMPLSTEELATLFHIPTNVILTQTSMERIESKRLSPPTNLPE
ncbi:MAG: hypothetical protein AAB420_00840 [Patescibacteria group bacterium]